MHHRVTVFDSWHDARVLRLSQIFHAAENDLILTEPKADVNGTIVRPLIVGDSAYPLKPWLLCPFKDNGALSRVQKKFNEELSRARIVSEHAYALTKGRWRVLQKWLDEDSDRIPDTIIACCILMMMTMTMIAMITMEYRHEGTEGIRRALVDYLTNL